MHGITEIYPILTQIKKITKETAKIQENQTEVEHK